MTNKELSSDFAFKNYINFYHGFPKEKVEFFYNISQIPLESILDNDDIFENAKDRKFAKERFKEFMGNNITKDISPTNAIFEKKPGYDESYSIHYCLWDNESCISYLSIKIIELEDDQFFVRFLPRVM